MYENREKVFTYDEYLEMYTELIEDYNEKKFNENLRIVYFDFCLVFER